MRICMHKLLVSILAVGAAFSLWTCATSDVSGGGPIQKDEEPAGTETTAAEPSPEDPFREKAALLAAGLDDRLLAAQALISGVEGRAAPGAGTKALLEKIPPGGIVLFSYNLDSGRDEAAAFIAAVGGIVQAASGIPPFIAVDHEGGEVHRFGSSLTRLPPPLQYWETARAKGAQAALAAVEADSAASARELRGVGVTMNLAPVAEVLTSENRLFPESRSYGPDPAFVEAAAAAFIKGMDAAGVVTALKHFPGCGGADPHRGPAVINGGEDALAGLTAPFRGLIQTARIPAVMMSHAIVPAWDGERGASLSAQVIQGKLREDLKFTGIVIADDFSMGAITAKGLSPAEAAVEALAAGADMVFAAPGTISAIHAAILAALSDGRLIRARLEETAARIIAEKLRRGLFP
ncbi:MAG: beta-glucosidase [Treponematales bacterium]